MKKLLMLGSSKAGKELIEIARNAGWYTIVTDNLSPEISIVKKFADEFWMISTSDFDVLEEKCKQENINAVISGISTFNIHATMELAKRLNLSCYCTPESWSYTTDKRAFKDICKSCNVPVSKDYYISENQSKDELDKIEYPVVVKAIDQSANRGMSYCNNSEEVLNACDFARSVSNSKTVIIEHMLKGREYAARYALAEGESSLVNFGAMLSQPGYPSNVYSFTTTSTNYFEKYKKEFDPYFKNALKKMQCNEGYAWVELMEDTDKSLNALEMGYRMAGDMLELQMAKVNQFNAHKWLFEVAIGIKHTKEMLPADLKALPERIVNSYILWSKKGGLVTRIEGVDKIKELIPSVNVEERSVSIGKEVSKFQYLLVITFDNGSYEEMLRDIQIINDNVSIYDENNENICIYYTDFKTLKELYENQ